MNLYRGQTISAVSVQLIFGSPLVHNLKEPDKVLTQSVVLCYYKCRYMYIYTDQNTPLLMLKA